MADINQQLGDFLNGGAAGGGAEQFQKNFTDFVDQNLPSNQAVIPGSQRFVQPKGITFNPAAGFDNSVLGKTIQTGGNLIKDIFEPVAKTALGGLELALGGLREQQRQIKQQQDMQKSMNMLDKQLALKIASLPNTPEGNAIKRRLMEFYVQRGSAVPNIFLPQDMDVSVRQRLGESAYTGFLALSLGSEFFGAKSSFDALVNKPWGTLSPTVPLKLFGATSAEGAAQNVLYDLAQKETPSSQQLQESAVTGAAFANIATAGIGAVSRGLVPKGSAKQAADILKETQDHPLVESLTVDATPGYRKEILVAPKELGTKRPTAKIKTVVPIGGEAEFKLPDISAVRKGDYVELPSGIRGLVIDVPPYAPKAYFDVAEAGQKLVNVNQAIIRTEQSIANIPSKRFLESVPPEAGNLQPAVGSFFSRKAAVAKLQTTLDLLKKERSRLADIVSRNFNLANVFDIRNREEVLSTLIDELRRTPPEVTLAIRDPQTGELSSLTVPFAEIKGGNVLKRAVLVPDTLEALRQKAPDVAKDAERTASTIASAQINKGRDTFPFIDDAGVQHNIPIENSSTAVLNSQARKALAAEGQAIMDPFTLSKLGGPKPPSILAPLDDPRSVFRGMGIQIDNYIRSARDARTYINNLRSEVSSLFEDILKEKGIQGQNYFGFRFLPPEVAAERAKLFKALDTDLVKTGEIKLSPAEQKFVTRVREITQELRQEVNKVRVRTGEEPFIGRENYITNLLTEGASLYLKRGGAIPTKLLELSKGKLPFLTARGLKPDELINVLLKQRTGGLPVEQDVLKAIDAMLEIHGSYIHMAPEYGKLNKVVDHFITVYGSMPEYAYAKQYVRNYMKYVSGVEDPAVFFRSLDNRLESTAIARDWRLFGLISLKNPLSASLRESVTYHIAGRPITIDIPSEAFRSFLEENPIGRTLKTITSPGRLLSFGMQSQYKIDLAGNIGFVVTNLTQPLVNGPANLRFGPLTAMGDTLVGLSRAWGELINYKANSEKWAKAGLLEVFNEQLSSEFGMANPTLSETLKGKGAIGSLLNFSTSRSEFINRVGTYYAAERNIMRAIKTGEDFWGDINRLTPQELKKFIQETSVDVSNKTNFRFGRELKSEVTRNPVWATALQYNSYALQQKEMLLSQLRTLRQSKEWETLMQPALADFHAGNMQGFINKVSKLSKTEAGGIIRYAFSAAITFSVLASIGGAFASEFFFGWYPRFLGGLSKYAQGVYYGDDQLQKDGLSQALIPRSFLTLGSLSADAIAEMTGRGKSIKQLFVSDYSPFKKPLGSIEALKAAVTGKPQFIFDDAGNATAVINPGERGSLSPFAIGRLIGQKEPLLNNAWASFFFGSRSTSAKSRLEELDKIGQLHLKDSADQRGKTRRANEILDSLIDAKPEDRTKILNDLMTTNQIDADMVNRIQQEGTARMYLNSAFEDKLRSLTPDSKAEYIIESNYIKSLTKEDKAGLFYKWLQSGVINQDTLTALDKKLAGKNPYSSQKDSQAAQGWVDFAAGAALIGLGVLDISIGPDRPGVEAITEGLKKFNQIGRIPLQNKIAEEGLIGTRILHDVPLEAKVQGKMLEINLPKSIDAGYGKAIPTAVLQSRRLRATAIMMDAVNKGDDAAALYASHEATIPFDRGRLRTAFINGPKANVKPSELYIGLMGYDGVSFINKETKTKVVYKLGDSIANAKVFAEQNFLAGVQKHTAFNAEKARVGEIYRQYLDAGYVPIDEAFDTALTKNLNQISIRQYTKNDVTEGVHRALTKFGQSGFGGHSSFITKHQGFIKATKEDIKSMLLERFSETFSGMDSKTLDDFVTKVMNDTPNFANPAYPPKPLGSLGGTSGPGAMWAQGPFNGSFESLPKSFKQSLRQTIAKGELMASGDVAEPAAQVPKSIREFVHGLETSGKTKVITIKGNDIRSQENFSDHVLSIILEGHPPISNQIIKQLMSSLDETIASTIVTPSASKGFKSLKDLIRGTGEVMKRGDYAEPPDLKITFEKVKNMLSEYFQDHPYLLNPPGLKPRSIDEIASEILRRWKF